MVHNRHNQNSRSVQHGSGAIGLLFATTLLAIVAGCAGQDCGCGRSRVMADLHARTQHDVGPGNCPQNVLFPPNVALDDGLTEEEAVALALWNNAQFHATLAQIGMARGDLIQAGLLTNPQFTFLFPGNTKQLEWTFFLPLEAFLLRNKRVELAERDFCRVADQLVQNGLDLVRDVRLGYADLVFAIERIRLADEALAIRTEVARLAKTQFKDGDISELELQTVRIEELTARAEVAAIREEATAAAARLQNLMGIGLLNAPIHPTDLQMLHPSAYDVDQLVAEAMTSRPDVCAARMAIDVAGQRAKLSRWAWLRLDAIGDGNSGGNGASNAGPGFRMDIPIFNRNEGGIVRSDWDVQQAIQNHDAVRDRVIMEVRDSEARLRQANAGLGILRRDVLSELQGAVELATKAYTDSGVPYFLVLQTTSRFIDARRRELELATEVRRRHAELERNVGRRLSKLTIADTTVPMDAVPVDGGVIDAPALHLHLPLPPDKQATAEDAINTVSADKCDRESDSAARNDSEFHRFRMMLPNDESTDRLEWQSSDGQDVRGEDAIQVIGYENGQQELMLQPLFAESPWMTGTN